MTLFIHTVLASDPIFPKFSREWLWETVNPSKLPNRKFVIEYRHVKGTVGKTHVTIGEAQFDFLAIATGPISRQIELFSVCLTLREFRNLHL